MPRANFDDEQFVTSKSSFKATGPTGDDGPLLWVWVWITQNRSGKAAAARGGAAGPFTGTWEVPVNVASPGEEFVTGRRARGHAVALVDGGNGDREAYWWSERIWLR
jgi:hypothetical protein